MDSNKYEQFNKLHLAYIEISKSINEVLEEQGINISREQLGVFKLLIQHRQLTLKEIAAKQGVFKTAISKRVKKLEEHGYIKRISSNDKREKLIVLTSKGLKFYENRQQLLYEGMEKKLNISEDDLVTLTESIQKINGILN